MNDTDPHKQLAAALGRVASGLFILTARHGTQETGMLVSWVQQCAFEPPHVSIAIKRGRPISDWLEPGAAFTLNILDDTQTDMIVHFGRGFQLQEPAFTGLDVIRPGDGAPVLEEALAYLECRCMSRQVVGDHDLVVAQVAGGRLLGEGHPIVHVRKSGFHY
jgi:flavin reductase (DIM6/NTAB) family NADH-FMN oxidoreductase RutF